jgi:hypothetical protein
LIKEQFFDEDIMLGPIEFYGKIKKIANNSKFLTDINKNDNENKIFTERHYNQLGLMILGNVICKAHFASDGRTKPVITFFTVPL